MPPSRPDLGINPGDIVDGKYRIDSILGLGGMGFVVAATHVELSQPVAIKFLLPEFAGRPEAVARFQVEAQSAARIRNEHVTKVFDVGRVQGVGPFLVMEYLVGSDLAAELSTWKVLPVQDAVDLLMQACEATAEAHALGIVHRDLKPSNLFIVRGRGGEPVVKLLDFGISKALPMEGQVPVNLTATTSVMGSPSYMSPEQVRSSRDVDHRTDVWALGSILFEMLTGRTPFEAETAQAMCAAIAADPVRPPRSLRSDIPEALERVILQCLEKNPARRVQSVVELARMIAPFGSDAARRGVQRIIRIGSEGASTMVLNAPVIRSFGPPTDAAWISGAQPQNRSRAALYIGGAALSVLLGAGWVVSRAVGGGFASMAPVAQSSPVAAAPNPSASAPLPSSSASASTGASAPAAPAASPPSLRTAEPAKNPPRDGSKPTKGGSVVDPLAEP